MSACLRLRDLNCTVLGLSIYPQFLPLNRGLTPQNLSPPFQNPPSPSAPFLRPLPQNSTRHLSLMNMSIPRESGGRSFLPKTICSTHSVLLPFQRYANERLLSNSMPIARTQATNQPDPPPMRVTLNFESRPKPELPRPTPTLNAPIVEFRCTAAKTIGQMTTRHIWRSAM